jgi:glycosyltransferase involved in cell wall biosynthesis
MRVGIEARSLASPEMRGLTRYTVNLLQGLSRRPDIDLVLFCREPPHTAHLDGVSARVVSGLTWRDFQWYDRWLTGQLRTHGIQVLHAPADRGLPLRSPCPTVVTLHGSFERAHWRSLFTTTKQRLWYWRHELANGRASAVITVSETTRRGLVDLGYAAARVQAIHLAAAPEFSRVADSEDAPIRESYGIRLPYVLCVSGYNPLKNLDTLVFAFDATSLVDYQLVIVADKRHDYAEHRARWSALRSWDRLLLIEADASRLPALYRGAAVCINPSRWESFGFQLVEAMASGTPLISSNAQALPEIAGDAAEYFDPDSRVELTGLLERLVRDKRRLGELQEAGYRRLTQFSWGTTIDRTVDVYRRVVAA